MFPTTIHNEITIPNRVEYNKQKNFHKTDKKFLNILTFQGLFKQKRNNSQDE